MPPTKLRAIRVSDEIWERAQAVAAERGVSLTSLVVEFLRELGETR